MNLSTKTILSAALAMALTACAGKSDPPPPGVDAAAACQIGGCSGQVCVAGDLEPPVTTCEWRPEYACYQSADCTVQGNGQCGWTPTEELETCLANASLDAGNPVLPVTKCVVGGCSGQLCLPEGSDLVSDCLWLEEYACYDDATCAVQSDGNCGWTPTDELSSCIEAAREAVAEE